MVYILLESSFKVVLASCLTILTILITAMYILKKRLNKATSTLYSNEKSITFIHPNCSDCGGGEKVLWEMIKALVEYTSSKFSFNKIYIISSSENSVKNMVSLVKSRFNLDLNFERSIKEIVLIRSNTTNMLKPQKSFTMLLQILGQFIFGIEMALKIPSNTYLIDTTGLPFSYLSFKIFGFKISSYTHYPFISDDMIDQVKSGKLGYVHSKKSNAVIKTLKVFYYKFILFLYKINGSILEFSFTNSTWTNNHIKSIWPSTKTQILYPPCGVEDYLVDDLMKTKRENIIVSLGQFRPEKDHLLQVEILKRVLDMGLDYKLIMIGGVRTVEDEKIVHAIKEKAKSLNVEKYVELKINANFSSIKELFKKAKIGLHTMKDEHFGISVIEMLASGLMTVAHDSAGPKLDIITSKIPLVGYLASSKNIN